MVHSNINSSIEGSAIPLAPPPPPQVQTGAWKNKNIEEPVNDYSPEQFSGKKSPLIEIEGNQVPSVLASAFNNPQNKNKKPFSYFLGGQPPDLSEKPSPSSVKRLHRDSPQTVVHRNIPRVLPLVSDDEYDESNMPVAHLQYNSPMPLYSQQNANEAFAQQTGVAQNGNQNYEPGRSSTYAMVHEMDEGRQPPPDHSARMDEPIRGEEYPHWQGYTNPNTQSPSLRRLRNFSQENGLQDGRRSRSHDQQDEHRFMGIERQDMNPSPTFHNLQRATGTGDGAWRESYATRDTQQAIQHQPAASQSYSAQDLRMSSRTPTWAEMETGVDHQQLDPNFAQKIAEAERPHVPASNAPTWASKAEQKHSKWQHQSVRVPEPQQFDLDRASWENRAVQKQQQWQGATDPLQPRQFAPVEPSWAYKAEEKRNKWERASGYDPAQNPRQFEPEQPQWANKAEQKQNKWSALGDPLDYRNQNYGPAPAYWSSTAQNKSDKWQQHYGSLERGRDFTRSPMPTYATQPQHTFTSGPVLAHSPLPYSTAVGRGRRARSQDPSQWRSEEKEPWMKPYIAPNVEHTKFPPQPDYGYHSRARSTGDAHHDDKLHFGLYYGTHDRRRLARSHSYNTMKTTSNKGVPHPVFKRGSHDYGGTDFTAAPDITKKIAPESMILGTGERSGRMYEPTPVWRDEAQSSTYAQDRASYTASQTQMSPPMPLPKPSPRPPMQEVQENEDEQRKSVRERKSLFESQSSRSRSQSSMDQQLQSKQSKKETVHGIADYKPLYSGEESTATRYETHQPQPAVQQDPSWTYTATQKRNQFESVAAPQHSTERNIINQQNYLQQQQRYQQQQQQYQQQQYQQQQEQRQQYQQQQEQRQQYQQQQEQRQQYQQQQEQRQQYQQQEQQRQQYKVSSQSQQSTQWQHERDAAKQKQDMEKEIERRYQQDQLNKRAQSTTSGYSSTSNYQQSQQTGGTPLQVQTYTTSGKKQWEAAPGASTKSHMEGDYIDPEGHKVSYTKEVYTSTDPGKEFSMLTEQEKKVMEEPLSPGVISRHVKTKYYKKSTYTSQTTTSTNQAPPVSTLAGRNQPLAIGAPLSHGVSSF